MIKKIFIGSESKLEIILILLWLAVSAQLVWWGELIVSQQSEIETLKINLSEFTQPPDRTEPNVIFMIIGEGLFAFVVGLVLLVFILHSIKKRLEVAKKEKLFFSAISHELKTPITAMQLILDDAKCDFDNKLVTNVFHPMKEELTRLLGLTKNALWASLLDSKKKFDKKINTNLLVGINNVVDDMNVLIDKSKLSVTIDVDEKIILYCGREILSILFYNLIDNSIRHNPNLHKVLHVEGKYKNDYEYCLEFHDNCTLIKQEKNKIIFSRFVQITDSGRKGGTGLGLYLVKKIITKLEAKINVSGPNKFGGNTFRILFNLK